ncbi:hybrid sensor histidine kinase/response regulator [Methylopila sp. M107]|uniref:ATP-binding response regulator n=1 Tax=Methylopila sp. M107 TaxID=1101190 RepID=UPI000370C83A|nr:hybrid sensor histidine kinase/response regulator [Methylopila sp. M107]
MSLMEAWDGSDQLKRRIEKLECVNRALMDHVERATDRQGTAYSLFQTAITLDAQVRARTEELTELMRSLEETNRALVAAKEEAELANRSKTRFLAAASHDLLQPLNATQLSISTLADMNLGPNALAIAGQVERGLKTIEELIKALIDISKLDAGAVRPNVHAVDLNELIEEIVEGFEPMAARKGLRFAIRLKDMSVESDPVLLKRILQNLVSNAVRYTRRGGVLVRARPKAGQCVIDVIDTGPGIASADLGRIYDEFYRCEGAQGAESVGLGLGLSIVKRTTLALGHGLQVTSRLGRGTRFRLRVAIAHGPARPRDSRAQPDHASRTTLAGAQVLVVENDAAAREALCRLLASWEADVSGVRSLGELAEAFSAGAARPHVAILDYHLDGGETGLDALGQLRARFDPATPAIVTTADHSAEVADRVRAAGVELIHKPIKPAQLRALINHLIGGARHAG